MIDAWLPGIYNLMEINIGYSTGVHTMESIIIKRYAASNLLVLNRICKQSRAVFRH